MNAITALGEWQGMPLLAAVLMGPNGPTMSYPDVAGAKKVLLSILAPIVENLRMEAAVEEVKGPQLIKRAGNNLRALSGTIDPKGDAA